MDRGFDIIDPNTGKVPDYHDLSIREGWAMLLTYGSTECCLREDGKGLVLLGRCGHYVYVPDGRFEIVYHEEKEEA